MNTTALLAVVICVATAFAPYKLRLEGAGWISRLWLYVVVVAIVDAVVWGARDSAQAIWAAAIIASCLAFGEIVLLVFDGLRRPDHMEICAANAESPLEGTPPTVHPRMRHERRALVSGGVLELRAQQVTDRYEDALAQPSAKRPNPIVV